jgi:phosphatidylserine decarboxylase
MRKTQKTETKVNLPLRLLYNTVLGRIILKPLVCPAVSKAAGFFLNSKPSKIFIKRFIKKNNIDLCDYEGQHYTSFNDFFTRKIKPESRPIASGDVLISPCDGMVTAFKIENDSSFFIKGVKYTIEELLRNTFLSEKYSGGTCIIFRLAVDNYHRYCFCADCNVETPIKIEGKYHTVQPIAMRRYKIFRENAREYTLLHSKHFGDIVQMEVGALLVGKISNTCSLNTAVKGCEKGKFLFGGSTIVLLLEKDKVNLDVEFFDNTKRNLETAVKYGEKIGTKC